MLTLTDEKILHSLINNYLKGKHILIVDDESEIKTLMSNFLNKSEIDIKKILYASDGLEAFEIIQKEKIGFIIIDLNMPNLGGMDLISKIRCHHIYDDIPILISSGNVDNQNLKDAMLFGVNNILVKPFNYKNFINRICKAISATVY